jgi:hypothetical protein
MTRDSSDHRFLSCAALRSRDETQTRLPCLGLLCAGLDDQDAPTSPGPAAVVYGARIPRRRAALHAARPGVHRGLLYSSTSRRSAAAGGGAAEGGSEAARSATPDFAS